MKKLKLFALCWTVIVAFSSNITIAYEKNAVSSTKYVGERPESVIEAFENQLYVTVMGGKVSGDGKIIQLSDDQEMINFATGLDEPKGMAFANGMLYVSDIDKIWEINSEGQKSVFMDKNDFPTPALYLNDLDSSSQTNELYVSDMGEVSYMRDNNGQLWALDSNEAKIIPPKGRIYAISLENKAARVVLDFNEDIRNPNGVTFDKDYGVLVSGFFSGKIVLIKDNNKIFMPGVFRGADQARYDAEGNIYISSWSQGKVWKLDKTSLQPALIVEGLKSAADFIIDSKTNTLIIPDMLSGTLNYIKLAE